MEREWLEADGLGGYASGTASGLRTRRYHALLLAARTPPTGRMVLVNGFDAWLDAAGGSVALTSQAYLPDVVAPDGAGRIESFHAEPWPRWVLRLPDGRRLEQELFAVHGAAVMAVAWRLRGGGAGVLRVRPFLSGRDHHGLHRENPVFRFEPQGDDPRVWRPYPGVPAIWTRANARYQHDPFWYRSFRYTAEQERGLDCVEDLAAPGLLHFDLAAGDAVWLLAADGHQAGLGGSSPQVVFGRLRDAERQRRAGFATRLHRAADAFLVRRGAGRSVVAGYPWFTDWGRDTFISLRGLCLAGGRPALARQILVAWAATASDGMLPNRFPDESLAPEFNAVDASLWYVIAAWELLGRDDLRVSASDRRLLEETARGVLDAYAKGARYGIHLDGDGLLAAGEPGVALTWMDARIGERPVTPRIGKPVEVQALWANALALLGRDDRRLARLAERALASFRRRFWNPARGCLYDVVDADHRPGALDASLRPNQIFAVGGLPRALLEGERARSVVDTVEARLWTPLGLRTLARGEPGYAPRYQGGGAARDAAYHQGTVWPWLLGPFVEAWLRVRGGSAGARRTARERFLAPLRAHLDEAGLGHVSEVADAEPPQRPGGCPFQAWSLGELLRLEADVLRDVPGSRAAAGRS